MTTLRRKSGIVTGLLAIFIASAAGAQTSGTFPDMPVDARKLEVLEKADEVYERADYKRAFFIYRNELAATGDKYGQYMVGFMYLTGKGVAEDRITASAWYRLAAERGTREFVGARDEVMLALDGAERSESDERFVELRKRYGDLVLLTRAIRDDVELLQSSYGLPAGAESSVAVMELTDTSGSKTESARRIERRISARLDYIGKYIDLDDVDVETLDIDELERQVAEQVSQLP
jgi:hypothetical protein